jgi:hypothetical protein
MLNADLLYTMAVEAAPQGVAENPDGVLRLSETKRCAFHIRIF